MAHAADPRTMLALSRDVFGHAPKAWWLTIPVDDLAIGDGFSATAQRGLEIAISEIRRLAAGTVDPVS
jgi:Ni,Fe-hydrogenase maturation factor